MALELEDLTGKIIGAAIAVHKALGPGFIESIYENALILELNKCGMKVDNQVEVKVYYDGKEVGIHRIDLLIEDEIVVELKATNNLAEIHFVIVRSYLKAMKKNHGLLINFSKPKLEVKRVIYIDEKVPAIK